jgi:hypothetical protein
MKKPFNFACLGDAKLKNKILFIMKHKRKIEKLGNIL